MLTVAEEQWGKTRIMNRGREETNKKLISFSEEKGVPL